MKWLIRIVGFLATAAVFTALRYSSLFLSIGAVGTSLITGIVFYFGVYFIPGRLIRRMDAKHTPAPTASATPPSDAPDEICAYPMMKQPSPVQEAPAAPASKEKPPKRRRCRPDVVGYQFAIGILGVLLVLAALNHFAARSEVDELRAELENEYRNSIEELEAQREADYYDGYEAGYSAGYTDGFEHCERGGILLPSQRD